MVLCTPQNCCVLCSFVGLLKKSIPIATFLDPRWKIQIFYLFDFHFTLFSPGENLNAQTAAPAPRRATLPVATAATLPRAPRVAAAILPKHLKLLKEDM